MRKLLLILLLIMILGISLIPGSISASTLSPFSSASDGQVTVQGGSYSTIQGAATGTVSAAATTTSIGQRGVLTNTTQVNHLGYYALYTGNAIRGCERTTIGPCTITSIDWYLIRVGSPTGTGTVNVRKASDDSVIGALGTIDVSTISTSAAWYTFSTPVYISASTDIRLTFEYTGPNSSNYIGMSYANGNTTAYGKRGYYNPSTWTDSGTNDDMNLQNILQYTYDVYRSYFYFDTSFLRSTDTITAVTLNLYGQADSSTTDFNITVTNGMATYPHDPLATGDYLISQYSGTGNDTFSTSGYSIAGYNTVTLNSTGRGWINKGGQTKFAVVSSRDVAATSPTGNEFVTVYTTDQAGTGNDPYLAITYTEAGGTTSSGLVVIGRSYTGETYDSGLTSMQITNNNTYAIDVTISGSDMIGGNTWTLADDAIPGSDIYGLKAGLSGGSYNIIVKKIAAYNTLKSNLASGATQQFGLEFIAPTGISDGATKTSTVSLNITAH